MSPFHPVEPPDEPRIFDAQGKEVAGVAGPFREGAELFLSCQVSGGKYLGLLEKRRVPEREGERVRVWERMANVICYSRVVISLTPPPLLRKKASYFGRSSLEKSKKTL